MSCVDQDTSVDDVDSSDQTRDDPIEKYDIHQTQSSPPYSLLQVRVVASLITILYSTGSISSLIAQYLLDRWTAEAGHNKGNNTNTTNLCHRNESDPEFKTENEIQARVSTTTVYYYYTTSGPALVVSVVFGALVDMVGRRPALISSVLGNVCKTVVIVLIVRFDLNTNFFYLAFALDGIGGAFFVNLLSMLSIMADVNAQKGDRILWITILSCLSIVTGSVTNIGQGYLIEYVSYFSACLALLVSLVLCLLCCIFFLPETLPASIQQQVSLRRLGEYIKRMYSMYLQDGNKETRWTLSIALAIFFMAMLFSLNLVATDTLYQRRKPLCWDPARIGYYMAFRTGAVSFLALVYLWIHQKIGCASDEVMAMIGMLFIAASFLMEAFVKNTWQMYMVPIISIPSANISTIIRGIMSCLAGPDRQGVLFSSIAVMEAICQFASTTVYNKVYAATVDVMPGAVYLVMAAVSMVTFFLFIPFFHFYEGPQRFLVQENDASPSAQKEEIA